MRDFDPYTASFQEDEGYDPSDLDPISYYEHDCGAVVRDGQACRSCGLLKRILERIESIQLQTRLHNSLARETGDNSHVLASQALLRVGNVWLNAARQLEARLEAQS